jgi:hypothetical protein
MFKIMRSCGKQGLNPKKQVVFTRGYMLNGFSCIKFRSFLGSLWFQNIVLKILKIFKVWCKQKKLSQFDYFQYMWNLDISWWMFGKHFVTKIFN